jgi:PAS domain S-box-containing protein
MDKPSITLRRTFSPFRQRYFRNASFIPAGLGVCVLAGGFSWWAAGRGQHSLAGILLALQLLVLAALGTAYWWSLRAGILLAPPRDLWDLRALLDVTPDGVFMLDAAGVIHTVSASAAQGLGISQAALVGRHICDFVPLGAGRTWEEIALDATQAGIPATLEYERDGIWFEAAFGPAYNAQGAVAGFAVHTRDITAQRHAAGALQESQRTFAAAFEHAPIGMALVGPDGRFLRLNAAHCHLLGYSEEDLIGKTGFENTHPDDLAVSRDRFNRALSGEFPGYEIEKRYKHALGHYVPVQLNASLVRGGDGQPRFFVGQLQDLTERRRALEQRLQDQKIETVGRLAAGIAHDFNNLLQAMLLQIQLLGSGRLGTEAAAAAAAEVEAQVQRGKSLVRQLLLFSRQDTASPGQLDLNELVANATRMLRRLVPANIAFSQQLDSGPLYVDGDRSQLEQVLVNLVVNAADAMHEGGDLVIRTGRENEDFTCLSVQDSGCGIPDEIRDRIFEPFFTTKPTEKGTGLGLSVVHDIVAWHAGYIDLVTEVGHGTTFTIVLPAAQSPRGAAVATAGPKPTPPLFPTQSAGERILVVEDETGARDALRQVLQALGYTVTTTASAEEAGLLPATPPFQLLLTDIMLPGILGTEVAAGLQDRWPGLHVILMSGYLPDDAVRREVESGRVRFLQKPFGVATLAAEIHSALTGGS